MKIKYILPVLAVILGQCAVAQIKPNGAMAPQLPLPTVPAAYGTGITINYVRTWEARRATVDISPAGLADNANYKTATAYVDGLGRPLQTVVKGNNYDGTMDIVDMNVYDAYGRPAKQYLPYATVGNGKFRQAAFTEQQAFYNTRYNDQTPFGRTDFENSPLNRPLKTYAPGNSWAGANVGTGQLQQFNRGTDSVWAVTVGTAAGAIPQFVNYYASGQLYKMVTVDEHGTQTVEYRDKNGKTLLKKVQITDFAAPAGGSSTMGHTGWLCTYYVYDLFGRLRTIIQPKAVEQLTVGTQPAGWQLTAGVMDELCFSYAYDGDGRMIYKKVPGAAPVYICYDKRDRPTYTQDGNQRNAGQWLVTFYDALDRPVSTALYVSSQTQAQLQAGLDAIAIENPVPVIAEANLIRLIFTYYDEYTMPGIPAYNSGYVATAQANIATGDEEPDVLAKTELTRGMVTGTQTRILDGNAFLSAATYYDIKGRALQILSGNHQGGTDVNTVVYSFTGKPLSAVQTHSNPASTTPGLSAVTVCTRNTYNNNYLLKTEKKINGGDWKRVTQKEYDAMGRPKKKWMGDAASNFYMNMDYNIRGWLAGINKADHEALESAPSNSAFYNAIFSEVLSYEYGFTNNQLNGNIAGIKWAAAGDRQARSYGFAYDRANRLAQADFTQKAASTWDVSAGIDYSVANLRYDANGNISSMAQKGFKVGGLPSGATGSIFIDQMHYTYLPNSNKLQQVFDTANDKTSRLGDFKYDAAIKTTTDYGYDANGSLVADNNKGISNIQYNHLNLPQLITVTGKGTIGYTYDAGGNKLRKTVTDNTVSPVKVTVTDYMAGMVYENNALQFMGHEEGRVRYTKQYYLNGDSAYTWQWDYFYKDHLGNVRSVVTEQKDTARYAASFETGVRAKETALFTNIAQTAYPISLIQNPAYPTDNTTSPNAQTSKLDGVNKQLGATLALKVMAGDKVDIGVKAWVPFAATAPDGKKITTTQLLSGLISALTNGASGLSGGKASPTELQTTGSPMMAGIDDFLNSHNDMVYPSPPRAYLNWILFDEQFKFVPSGSGFIRVGYYDDLRMQGLATEGLPITKSGYLFVYLSNEVTGPQNEQGQLVFFDNLTVQHYTGPLVEENVYYPMGLQMAGISSRAVGRLRNKYTFNGNEEQKAEFSDGSGLETMDFNARMYDPQLGRFWQQDPLVSSRLMLTPYNGMSNNPVNRIDPTGALDEWVQVDGQMKWDDRVTSQKTAVEFYGENAIHRKPGHDYKDNNGETIVLGENRNFTKSGYALKAENSTPPTPIQSIGHTEALWTVVKYLWKTSDFVAEGETKFTVGVQAGIKLGAVECEAGFYTYELGGFKGDLVKKEFGTVSAEKIVHNYVNLELGIKNTPFAVGAKYDYNYKYYNSYYGPKQDGPGTHDFGIRVPFYEFGPGGKHLARPDVGVGVEKQGDKTFYGIDAAFAFKVIFGGEINFKIGFRR